MLRGFRFLIVLAVVLAAPRLADACSCLAASPCRQYATADAVFAGEVLEVTAGPEGGPPRRKVARLRVARAYKGPVQVGQIVAVEMPGGSSASCSLDVAPGARFVIYGGVEGGAISTNLCRGSYALAAGQPWPDLPPEGGVVSGRLARPAAGGAWEPVPAVPVWIATADGRISATTDAAGEFRLSGVPAGTWSVQFGLGADEQADVKVELQSPDDCAEIFAAPRPRP